MYAAPVRLIRGQRHAWSPGHSSCSGVSMEPSDREHIEAQVGRLMAERARLTTPDARAEVARLIDDALDAHADA